MENTTFENHTFSIKKSISFGWMRTKQFWKMMLLIIITVIAITVPSNISSQYSYYLESSHLQPTPSFVAINILLQIITQIISIWLGYNIVKMGLKMTSGHTAKYKEMFHYDKDTIKNIWKYFLGSLLLGLLVILGLILFIIPGIYFATKYAFVPYLIVDKGMGIFEAFGKSAEMTLNNKWSLIGFYLISGLIILLGLLLLVIGTIPASIIVTFANYYIYRELLGEHMANKTELKAAQ